LRAGLSAGDRRDRLSSRSRRALRRAARAHGCFLHRLARQPAGRGCRARLSHTRGRACPAVRFPGVQRRMLFRDLHPARARRHARSGGPRFCERGRVPVAVQALEPAGAAHRLCRRRPTIPRALLGAAQRLGAASADAGAARGHRRLWRRGACRRKSPALRAKIRSRRPDHRRPLRFFLWLDVSAQGGDEAVALRLWREAGLRVVPGRYLARDQADGSNPGRGYIRVAMVQDQDTTAQALHRLVAVLG